LNLASTPGGSPVHPWVASGLGRTRWAIGPAFLNEWSEIRAFVQRAEALGFDACWANDHPNRLMDCWTALSALAVATERIRLISLVSCIYYRSPYLLARQAADVDRLSEGRVVLGIGSGWDAPEFAQMCVPMPSTAIRQETMQETLQIVRGLWRGEPFTFTGKYRQVKEAALRVLPVQQPYVPILIAAEVSGSPCGRSPGTPTCRTSRRTSPPGRRSTSVMCGVSSAGAKSSAPRPDGPMTRSCGATTARC
jgi:alkanesulfonate monooxygenase SsuD/methylene tetrahydromethanopterin reductase-like flavin-dependent oxidoreductase (luciferase family)